MRYAMIALLLAGCATPEQRADRIIAIYGPLCDRLGYEKNSDKWRDCVTSQAAGAAARPAPTVQRPMSCTTVGNTTQCN